MYRLFIVVILILLTTNNLKAQDTMNVNGVHYEFLQGQYDTIKYNNTQYIIKYVVKPEMAEKMFISGKIYVVVMVLTTIFAAIFAFLVTLNRKIKKLEVQHK